VMLASGFYGILPDKISVDTAHASSIITRFHGQYLPVPRRSVDASNPCDVDSLRYALPSPCQHAGCWCQHKVPVKSSDTSILGLMCLTGWRTKHSTPNPLMIVRMKTMG
jgi:hypothetical protein